MDTAEDPGSTFSSSVRLVLRAHVFTNQACEAAVLGLANDAGGLARLLAGPQPLSSLLGSLGPPQT